MPPIVKKLAKPVLVVLVLGAIAYGARMGWRATRPREIGVCLYTDYAFRQRPNWNQLLAARFSEANRIFQDTKVQWKVVSEGANDPTSASTGLDRRRATLDDTAQCKTDVIVSVTGQPEGKRAGSASPFSRTAIVVDAPDKSEADNTRTLARALAYFFGAPTEPAGSGTLMTEAVESGTLSPKTTALIRELRGYQFAAGIEAMTPEWDKRATSAIEAASPADKVKPAVHAHRMMAMALASEHKLTEALVHLREAVKIEPANAILHAELAGALAQSSEGPEALKEMAEAVRLDPNNALLHAGYAGLLAKQGDPDASIDELNRAVKLAPENALYQLSLGALLMQVAGRAEDGVAAYQTAVRLAPESPLARAGLERAEAMRAKMQEDAVRQRQRAQQAPANGNEQYNLGVMEARAGNLDAAIRAYEKAAELGPSGGRALASAAMMRYLRGDYTGAWKSVKAARAANFEPPSALVTALRRKQPE